MLILPAEHPLDWKRPPLITLLLIVLGQVGTGGLVVAIAGCYLLAILCHAWMARRRAV